MQFLYSRRFTKQFERLTRTTQIRVIQRQNLFAQDKRNSLLNDHALLGDSKGLRSFSITGDVRIIYEVVGDDIVLLLKVGTHHELYGA
jgi:addiction module RelE/StbE family toxin